MLIILVFILVLIAIGGGIYLWVKRQRKNLLKKKNDLAASSQILDPAKSSVLDSVISPVSTPTSSSASDRPQINVPADHEASGSTDGGDSKYVARLRHLAPTVKDLAEKLMAAWNDATDAHNDDDRAFYLVRDQKSTIYLGLDSRFLVNVKDTAKFVDDTNAHYGGVLSNLRNWYDLSRLVPVKVNAASDAFEALREALKSYDKGNTACLPRDLQVLYFSARHLLDTCKGSIENLLRDVQESAQRVEKAELEGDPIKRPVLEALFIGDEITFAEGTHEDDKEEVAEARKALKDAIMEAIRIHTDADERFKELSKIFETLEELEKQTFIFPKKPTPEEIQRFLTELEDWAKKKLATQRAVEGLMEAARKGSTKLHNSIKALKRSRGRTSPILNDAKRVIDEALILTADKVVKDLETAESGFTKSQLEAGQKLPKVTPAVTKTGSEDDAQIKVFRSVERTFAFALAQQTVASAKLAQMFQDEPPMGRTRQPRVNRSDSFEKYLGLNTVYFADTEVEAIAHDKWAEGKDLVQMAFDARQAKVAESKTELTAKLAEGQKTLPSSPPDELLVVRAVADKMVTIAT